MKMCLTVNLTLLAFVVAYFPCALLSANNNYRQTHSHGHDSWFEKHGDDDDEGHGREDDRYEQGERDEKRERFYGSDMSFDNMPREEHEVYSGNEMDHPTDYPFRVKITVKHLALCSNVSLVLHPYFRQQMIVFRYVVAYWPKSRPGEWKEQFAGGDRQGKQVVPITGLSRSTDYAVRVTALLEDGSDPVFTSSFTTSASCKATDHPSEENSQHCYPNITERVWSHRTLYIVWTKSCDTSVFDRYIVKYSTKHDHRQMYVNINNNSVIFRDMIDVPYKVSVAGVNVVNPTDVIFSKISVTSVPRIEFTFPGSSTRDATLEDSGSLLGSSSDGLLVAVIILSILFVSSAAVAIYLCCYLRMHRQNVVHQSYSQGTQRSQGNLDLNGAKQELRDSTEEGRHSMDSSQQIQDLNGGKRDLTDNLDQGQSVESIDVTTQL